VAVGGLVVVLVLVVVLGRFWLGCLPTPTFPWDFRARV
jgi:hypothetical protein